MNKRLLQFLTFIATLSLLLSACAVRRAPTQAAPTPTPSTEGLTEEVGKTLKGDDPIGQAIENAGDKISKAIGRDEAPEIQGTEEPTPPVEESDRGGCTGLRMTKLPNETSPLKVEGFAVVQVFIPQARVTVLPAGEYDFSPQKYGDVTYFPASCTFKQVLWDHAMPHAAASDAKVNADWEDVGVFTKKTK